jgi:2-keto-4-pentenoate hydratase/2-oxohepta-3-ene-1,7-dioic acid hydratase in catechol pathway
MSVWLRFERAETGGTGFGVLDGGAVRVHDGDLFSRADPTGETLPLDALRVLPPCRPSKLIGLWNNYRALAEKTGQAVPLEPLYFIKGANSYAGPDDVIPQPQAYEGRVVYEGELGVVIGRRCKDVAVGDARKHIFGFTCVNDVTALDLITRDPAFAQWTRAKSFDGFGALGPTIATDLEPASLVVRTLINGRERQNYPCSDMIFSPDEIVSRLSQELTLEPGDVIACGTSLGVGPLRRGCTVEVAIDGIGTLRNRFE